MNNFGIFSARLLPQEEFFVKGHRACQGCGPALVLRQMMKALGPNTIIANATGCMEIICSPYPFNSWRVPWFHSAFENAAASASGISSAIEILKKKKRYFHEHERIKVVAVAGDGGTADIGMQALSGALERGHDFIYLCYDNEAYMNTGIQRSSATPFGATTTTSPAGKRSHGQFSNKKQLAEIAVAHHIPYVATASPSHPFDLIEKFKKAREVHGPAFMHVFAPCPTGWRCGAETTITLARMAVETGLFPLYEVVDGKYRMTVKTEELMPIKAYDEVRDVRGYLKAQGRFRHLTDDLLDRIQEYTLHNYRAILDRCEESDGGEK